MLHNSGTVHGSQLSWIPDRPTVIRGRVCAARRRRIRCLLVGNIFAVASSRARNGLSLAVQIQTMQIYKLGRCSERQPADPLRLKYAPAADLCVSSSLPAPQFQSAERLSTLIFADRISGNERRLAFSRLLFAYSARGAVLVVFGTC